MVLGIEASNILAGGGVVHLKELLRHAKPAEHDFELVIVWAPQTTLNQLPDFEWLEKQSHPWLNRSIFFRILWLKFIFPKAAKHKIDVLFSPGGNVVSFYPTVTMCQNLLPFDAKERNLYGFSLMRLRLNILRYTQTRAFRKAKGIIFLTASSIYYVFGKSLNNKKNTVIIPHGINPVFFRKPSSDAMKKTIKLLYVSIVDVYKHQWNVVEAVFGLLKKGYDIELTLVGGVYQPAWKKLKRALNLHPDQAHKITYLPAVPYEELSFIYQSADIFVFASSCETFSLVLLEAMSSGLPIACADRDTLKDTLGDAGVYFDPYDADSIEQTIEKLVNDKSTREKISIEAYTKSQSYSWSVCAEHTFLYLSKIAKGN
ncbi:MAG TPA: glycosyltransferase family 1 protein [Cytophagaceae bacterium]|jgi:glycosyltransferase involved in cell wall biosynthesis|nr:glycosyltransferase family 1 protein [Cytophagaceae bacterium]